MSRDHQTEQKTPINASETVKANSDIKTSPHLDIQKINELVRVVAFFIKFYIFISIVGIVVMAWSMSNSMCSSMSSSVSSTPPVTSSSIGT